MNPYPSLFYKSTLESWKKLLTLTSLINKEFHMQNILCPKTHIIPLGLIVKHFGSSQGFAVVVSSIYQMVPHAIEHVCQVNTEVS